MATFKIPPFRGVSAAKRLEGNPEKAAHAPAIVEYFKKFLRLIFSIITLLSGKTSLLSYQILSMRHLLSYFDEKRSKKALISLRENRWGVC
jgi:hypothetical protein